MPLKGLKRWKGMVTKASLEATGPQTSCQESIDSWELQDSHKGINLPQKEWSR